MPMRELSYLVAFLSVTSLLATAFLYGSKILRPDHASVSPANVVRATATERLYILAFVLAAIAALLGVVGWFQR